MAGGVATLDQAIYIYLGESNALTIIVTSRRSHSHHYSDRVVRALV